MGYSEWINQSILELIQKKWVTSSTIMVNGPAFLSAVSSAKDSPHISWGIHLNLTEFQSLTNSPVLHKAKVIDSSGRFTSRIRQVWPSVRLIRACYFEFCSQIESYLDQGISLSHLDSHHHIHTIPWLLPAIKGVQIKYNIRQVRNTLNWYPEEQHASKILLLKKRLWSFFMAHMVKTKLTKYFSSLETFLSRTNDLPAGKDCTWELMCHPGNPRYSSHEKKLFESELFQTLINHEKLISYRDLA